MKKLRFLILPLIVILLVLIVASWIIDNPKTEDCETLTVNIDKIAEGSTFDIVFYASDSSNFYINRGLEQGLNLDSLNAKVLNKTVTLHLPKLLGGLVTSSHIAQLEVGNEIVYTEFK